MTSGRAGAAGSGEDELLSRLYQQIPKRQAARFAAGYGLAASLDRYRAWLGERAAEEHSRPEAIRLQGSMAPRGTLAGSRAGTAAQGTSGPVVAGGGGRGSTGSRTPAGADWNAEQAVTALFSAHYRPLVRLAVLLLRDVATAEEIVQDSFVAMHAAWPRLRDYEKALAYLRQSVVHRSRSALPRRMTVVKNAPKPAPNLPATGQGAPALLDRTAVITALRSLPPRQREALVLRYYAGLPEAQIAAAMGISPGAVKSHTARAIASLRAVLEVER